MGCLGLGSIWCIPSFDALNGVGMGKTMLGSLNLVLEYDSETSAGLMMKVLFMLLLTIE